MNYKHLINYLFKIFFIIRASLNFVHIIFFINSNYTSKNTKKNLIKNK